MVIEEGEPGSRSGFGGGFSLGGRLRFLLVELSEFVASVFGAVFGVFTGLVCAKGFAGFFELVVARVF